MTINKIKSIAGVIAGVSILSLAPHVYALPKCDAKAIKKGYACEDMIPTPVPTPIPSAVPTPDYNDSWVTNQGGGEKACDTTSIPAGVETQVSSDNAGAVDNTRLWNYLVSGYIQLIGPIGTQVTLTLYAGSGSWSPDTGPVNLETFPLGTYTLTSETQSFPFQVRQWLINSNDYVGFWLTIMTDQPVECAYTNYDTTEHD